MRWLLAAAQLAAASAGDAWGDPELAALVTDPELSEISGLAASRRHPGLLWVHNDSGDAPRLYAIDAEGTRRATLSVTGTRNRDWEDAAAFTVQGDHYLLIGDVGDNGGLRADFDLLIVREPEALGESSAGPEWTVRARWPDGARDCEAVAVDAAAGWIYLIAKKRVPPELWRVPLRPAAAGVVTAELVGRLEGVVQPSAADLQRNPVFGRYRSQITATDLAPDGRTLAVLNYRTLYLYRRGAGEEWSTAVARAPAEIVLPWIPQAEAVGFAPDGRTLWISSEKLPAPLLRIGLD
ncbi:MAG TPA: hypothetical protein VFG21_04185 [Xanthomonadaceae bacterium]|nr:hypothetical protein [Xanthomonadaceae bacterium]